MTFYDIFREFKIDHSVPGDLDEIINVPEKGYEIIIGFLKTHGKEASFKIVDSYFAKRRRRINHILETFAIGDAIIKSPELGFVFRDYLRNSDFNLQIDECWLLISLLHDYAYFCGKQYSIATVRRSLDRFYSQHWVAPTYSKETVANYYEMIKSHPFDPSEPCDHGIVGAISAYSSLSRMWYGNVEKLGGLDRSGQAFDLERCIVYSPTDINRFQNVCKAIAQHNIFKPSPDRVEFYKEFNLDELLDSTKKIKIEDTLTYLLSIVDTIEFTKRLCDNDHLPSDISKLIDLDFSYHRVAIYYKDLFGVVDDTKIEKYINGIESLQDWLDVEIESRRSDCAVFVELNIR